MGRLYLLGSTAAGRDNDQEYLIPRAAQAGIKAGSDRSIVGNIVCPWSNGADEFKVPWSRLPL